ncbi:MAG: hypothetical protein QXV17_14360 [Candidatus Micrarchaeaceae archaeon]
MTASSVLLQDNKIKCDTSRKGSINGYYLDIQNNHMSSCPSNPCGLGCDGNITATTNQSVYGPYENIVVTGKAPPGALIGFMVWEPGCVPIYGNTTYADKNGNYTFTIHGFPKNDPLYPEGTYYVAVGYNYEDFSEVGSTVVPFKFVGTSVTQNNVAVTVKNNCGDYIIAGTIVAPPASTTTGYFPKGTQLTVYACPTSSLTSKCTNLGTVTAPTTITVPGTFACPTTTVMSGTVKSGIVTVKNPCSVPIYVQVATGERILIPPGQSIDTLWVPAVTPLNFYYKGQMFSALDAPKPGTYSPTTCPSTSGCQVPYICGPGFKCPCPSTGEGLHQFGFDFTLPDGSTAPGSASCEVYNGSQLVYKGPLANGQNYGLVLSIWDSGANAYVKCTYSVPNYQPVHFTLNLQPGSTGIYQTLNPATYTTTTKVTFTVKNDFSIPVAIYSLPGSASNSELFSTAPLAILSPGESKTITFTAQNTSVYGLPTHPDNYVTLGVKNLNNGATCSVPYSLYPVIPATLQFVSEICYPSSGGTSHSTTSSSSTSSTTSSTTTSFPKKPYINLTLPKAVSPGSIVPLSLSTNIPNVYQATVNAFGQSITLSGSNGQYMGSLRIPSNFSGLGLITVSLNYFTR